MNKSTPKTIAGTIFDQLGGDKFVAMTGAKNFDYCSRYLRFQLPPRAANKAQYVKITLRLDGTYDVEFMSVKRNTHKVVVISTHEQIYADHLAPLITEETNFLGWN